MADFERNITGGQAVSDVMEIMGLTPPATISTSNDATASQLWRLATEVGQQLITESDWQFMQRDHTITTVPGTSEYDLPNDWDAYESDSSWNRTTRLPVIGALREYEWQALQARSLAGTTFALLFRIDNNQVVFYEVPSTAQTIVMPYTSRAWCESADATPVPRDNLQVDSDVILYDSQLFKLALKLAWRAEKGFDVGREQAAYDMHLKKCTGKDKVARTLTLDRRGRFPYLGVLNTPDTGYGS